MPPSLLDALVYAWLVEQDHGAAAKALRASLGVRREELLTLVAVSGGDLAAATARFTRAAAAAAAAAAADDSSSDDEEEAAAPAPAPAPARVPKAAKRARSASAASAASAGSGAAGAGAGAGSGAGAGDDWQPAAGSAPARPAGPRPPRASNAPFHRVDAALVAERGLIHDAALADNTYEGTFAGSGWGAKANDVLGKVKGKDFRHEKTKKKRGTYRGGAIESGATASFKFADD